MIIIIIILILSSCYNINLSNVITATGPNNCLYFLPLSQKTPRPTGCTRVPPGRSAARTPSTRRSSWRRSSSLTCTSPVTAGTRWRGSSTSPRGRWKSGSKTAEWRWRNVIRNGPNSTRREACGQWKSSLKLVDSERAVWDCGQFSFYLKVEFSRTVGWKAV